MKTLTHATWFALFKAAIAAGTHNGILSYNPHMRNPFHGFKRSVGELDLNGNMMV
jgi:hypothetical protein